MLDENQETLTLVINHLQKDVESKNDNIVKLALTTIANIGSEEMCQVMCPYVVKCVETRNYSIKKHGVAALKRIIMKCPNLADQCIQPLHTLLSSTSDLLLPAVELAIFILDTTKLKRAFDSFVPNMINHLNRNVRGSSSDVGYNACYCCVILEFLRRISDTKYIELIEDTLADIILNCPKEGVGYSVGFSASKCALEMNVDEIVKEMAINYLARLLYDGNANLRFSVLKYFELKKNKLGEQLIPFVNRLLLNLQDRDECIRLFALKICVSLSQYGSQKEIVQCIIHSIEESSETYTKEASNLVCRLLDICEAEVQWKFDCLIQLAIVSGRYIDDIIAYKLIALISANDIQTYALTKLFPMIRTAPLPLKKATVWALGEYYDIMKNIVEDQVIIIEILKCQCDNAIKLSTLAKIAAKCEKETRLVILKLSARFNGGHSFEENQRYNELVQLCENDLYLNSYGRMPVVSKVYEFGSNEDGNKSHKSHFVLKRRNNVDMGIDVDNYTKKNDENDEDENDMNNSVKVNQSMNTQTKKSDILNMFGNESTPTKQQNKSKVDLDIDSLISGKPTTQSKPSGSSMDLFGFSMPQSQPSTQKKYDILNMFGNESTPTKQQPVSSFDLLNMNAPSAPSQPAKTNNSVNILDLNNQNTTQNQTQQNDPNEEENMDFADFESSTPQERMISVAQNEHLSVIFKVKQNGESYENIVEFTNISMTPINSISFKVAALRGIKLDIKQIDKASIQPNEVAKQEFITTGTSNGNVPVKIKVDYVVNGSQLSLQSAAIKLNQ